MILKCPEDGPYEGGIPRVALAVAKIHRLPIRVPTNSKKVRQQCTDARPRPKESTKQARVFRACFIPLRIALRTEAISHDQQT